MLKAYGLCNIDTSINRYNISTMSNRLWVLFYLQTNRKLSTFPTISLEKFWGNS